MTSTPPGRRAQVTRARIERTAVSLFLRRGFEDVTVEDVARAAQVSPATFYRYFATKEEVVVSYGGEYVEALRRTATAVGPGVPRREHLPRVLVAFAAWLETQQEVLALQGDLVTGQPALVHRTVAVQQQLEAELAAVLAELAAAGEPDAATTVAAAVGMAVLRVAICSWQAGSAVSIVAAVQQALVELPALFSPGPH